MKNDVSLRNLKIFYDMARYFVVQTLFGAGLIFII